MFNKFDLYLAAIPWVIMFALWFCQLIYSLYCWVNDESAREVFCPGLCKWMLLMGKHKPYWSDHKQRFGEEPRYWLWSCDFKSGPTELHGFFPVAFFNALCLSAFIFIWQIGLPVFFIIASLFGIRYFFRFKKKVNKALEKCNLNGLKGDKHIVGEE